MPPEPFSKEDTGGGDAAVPARLEGKLHNVPESSKPSTAKENTR